MADILLQHTSAQINTGVGTGVLVTPNRDTLAKFGEDNGKPTFNGLPIGGPGGASDASEVSFDNPTYSTVEEALNSLLYIPPVVSLSGGATHEVGTTVSTVNLSWTINKTVLTQSIAPLIGSLAPALRSYQHTGQSITSNRAYVITVNDGKQDATSSTTVAFSHKRYWGVSANATLTDAQIIALTSEFSTTRVQTRTFNATGGRYLYIAYPASWGAATFTLGGLAFSAMTLVTRNFVNASGNTTSFYIYRSEFLQNGASMVLGVS